MTALSSAELIRRAQEVAPLLRETAREAELARQPLDRVIEAVRAAGLFAMMVPRRYGGHEADIDTFFEVTLILSEADASMGWVTGFYIEHNWWFLHFPADFQEMLFADTDHVLAPGALSMGGGRAQRVEGGYRLSGQWQWGTGIVHGTWVIAGALLEQEGGPPVPMFFTLPRADTTTIDTWHMAGMCATGSHDFAIDDVFVPASQALAFEDMVDLRTSIRKLHEAPLYRTPMVAILGFAAGLPILGAAKSAVAEFCAQSRSRMNVATGRKQSESSGRQVLAAQAALTVEMAEMLMREVLRDLMQRRDSADRVVRAGWLARITHAVALSRQAVNQVCEAAGAGANNLANPLQRALRDVNTASCHTIFDRNVRYRDLGRTLVGMEPISTLL